MEGHWKSELPVCMCVCEMKWRSGEFTQSVRSESGSQERLYSSRPGNLGIFIIRLVCKPIRVCTIQA